MSYGCRDCTAPNVCVDNFCVPPSMSSQAADDDMDSGQEPCEEGTDVLCYEGPTGTDLHSPCRSGRRTCVDGKLGRCVGQKLPGIESCNAVDDDCDGETDEDLKLGASTCQNGKWVCDKPNLSVAEICDGLDTDCDGTVDEGFDLDTDVENCGSCGHTCASGQSCCDGTCVDLETDKTSCGRCGNVCPRATECCSGVCVDTQTDGKNCGGCGSACAEGTDCCAGGCFDTLSDPEHCGAFCLHCGVTEACCFGECADLGSAQHCGSCERACNPGTEQCCDGACSTTACTQ